MSDVFDEVDEQLRSARYESWFRRGWPYAVGALAVALVVALGVWAWDAHGRSEDAKASQAYDTALAALVKNDRAAAVKGFTEVSEEGSRGYRTLALMQLAGLKLADNHAAEAVALLDRAAKSAPGVILADAAALQAAMAELDTAPLAQTLARLQPLTGAERPYRALAREASAMAKLANGRLADAKGDLQLLTVQPDVSENAQNRARAALAMIDSGAAAAVAPTLKAELALAPQPTTPPAAMAAGALAGAQ